MAVMGGHNDSQEVTMYCEKGFDLKPFRFVFVNFAISGKSLEGTLESVLKGLDSSVGLKNIVRQTIFCSPFFNRQRVSQLMKAKFPGALPATSYVPQPLCSGEGLGAELWAFIPDKGGEQIRKVSDNVTIVNLGSLKWAFVSGVEPEEENFFDARVRSVFQRITQLLRGCNFELRQLVRTWCYVGDILGEERGMIRYDEMNRVRNNFYHTSWENGENYPASTGIGMSGNGFILDGVALQADGEKINDVVVSIHNPLQTNPCEYAINKPVDEKPAFSRAIVINCNTCQIIFISGTASIRASEVIFTEDIEKQAETTIENIAHLVGEDNLVRKYGFPKGASLKDVQQIRVYLKRPHDYPVVKGICEQAFGKIPQIYCTADICRPALLVEIEAVAIVEP